MPYEDLVEHIADRLTDEIAQQAMSGQMNAVRETIERLLELAGLDDEDLQHQFREYLPPSALDDWWEWADIKYDEARIANALHG